MIFVSDRRQSRMLVWWVWRSAGRGQPRAVASLAALSDGLWTRDQEENIEPDIRITRWKWDCRIMGLWTRYSTLAAPTPCNTFISTLALMLDIRIYSFLWEFLFWKLVVDFLQYFRLEMNIQIIYFTLCPRKRRKHNIELTQSGIVKTRPDQTRPDQTRPEQTRPDLAHQSYPLRVSSELCDVLLDPVQSRHLVQQAKVAHVTSRHWRGIGVEETWKCWVLQASCCSRHYCVVLLPNTPSL